MYDNTNAIDALVQPELDCTLLRDHREHLQASGLLDSTIDSATIYSVNEEKVVRQLLGWLKNGSGGGQPAVVVLGAER